MICGVISQLKSVTTTWFTDFAADGECQVGSEGNNVPAQQLCRPIVAGIYMCNSNFIHEFLCFVLSRSSLNFREKLMPLTSMIHAYMVLC